MLGDIGLGEASATGPSPARPHSASLVSLTRIPQAHPPSLGAWIAPEAALMKRSFAFLGAALLCSLAVVSDVHAQQAWNSVTLSWTTPGDDSLSGSASVSGKIGALAWGIPRRRAFDTWSCGRWPMEGIII